MLADGRSALLLLATVALACAAAAPPPGRVTIDLAAGPLATIQPNETFGAALDGMGRGDVARTFTRFNIARLKAAGLGPVSYRLRTELGIEAWHWTGEGRWSDPRHRQGYWVGAIHPRGPVLTTWGYALPRRGDTIDQADDTGYSRLDDGDPGTFWKSNPYLDPRYTGEARGRPQWVVVEFTRGEAVDEARIDWANPFARRYEAQYWIGADEYDAEGRWVTFPGGAVNAGTGGHEMLALAPTPIRTKFVRILLERSSNTAAAGSTDPRDAIGFAIGELALGVRGPDGALIDAVRHGPSRRRQTIMHVSSTDPWHRAIDRDRDLEQPGFDLVFRSGLTRGSPMMVPVGALYDTPENAAAEIRFLEWRHYPIGQVELGEEPDGQYVAADDYGALYVEFADAIHRADPHLSLGGPSLQQATSDLWLDPSGDRSWTSHFIRYLKQRGRLGDLGFFTFEHYPFDDLCGPLGEKLLAEPGLMDRDLARLRADGVPADIPWIISEYGFSAYSGEPEVRVESALVNAEIAAGFAGRGGSAAYLFGYVVDQPFDGARPCAGAGNLMLWQAGGDGRAHWPMPTFWGARLLARDWAGRGGTLYRASADVRDDQSRLLVTAHALRRPDGAWSLLLINRDPGAAHRVSPPFPGPFAVSQYGPAQYAWRARRDRGRPTRDLPPARRRVVGDSIDLPANSLTVVNAEAAP